ncbi:Pollen preferential protein [Melia azedarach]|uniref:Pollen preferential protein n=1 Tax=Melia azedarach TaxID=155640 RepID=A0ACC1YQ11_MELAZ|nr:Pollen preferential protein [Melia azedarach]
MAGPTLIPSPSLTLRRQPLLPKDGHKKGGKKFGELAGGTTAECAAVCCCCPCTVMNLLVLAVYRVPAGLCKKAWRKQRKRHRILKRKQVGGLLIAPTIGGPNAEEKVAQTEELLVAANSEENEKAAELEKEMWDRFHGAGFWRSPSQKESECENDVVK